MWLAFQQNRHNYRYSICWWMIWKGKSTRRSSLPHRSGAHDGVIAHAAYSNHRRVWEKVTKCFFFFFFLWGVLFKSPNRLETTHIEYRWNLYFSLSVDHRPRRRAKKKKFEISSQLFYLRHLFRSTPKKRREKRVATEATGQANKKVWQNETARPSAGKETRYQRDDDDSYKMAGLRGWNSVSDAQ